MDLMEENVGSLGATSPTVAAPRRLSRLDGGLPARPDRAPGVGTVGSLDWIARNLYGGPSQFVELMWTLLASEGKQADERWKRLLNVYLGWCERYDPTEGGEPPSLNEACTALKVNLRELLAWLSHSVTEVMAVVAKQRLALGALELADATIENGKLPDGFKDRQMALAAIGAVQGAGPLVTVNNTQQVAVVNKEQMRTPLLRFRETTEAIDEVVRGTDG